MKFPRNLDVLDHPAARPLPQWIAHAGAVILVIVPGFIKTDATDTAFSSAGSALAMVATIAAVLLRARFPRSAVIAVVVTACASIVVDGPVISHFVAVLICVFGVSNRTNRPTTLLLAGIAALVLGAASLIFLTPLWSDARAIIQICAMIGFAAAAGDASRSRREFIQAITERARRAEETKESEARRRVAEERIKIARDLHDVLAHQIAVINMHANVASQALPERTDDAERSLTTIRQSSRAVLSEIGSLLAVLRTADGADVDTATALGPAPGLAMLDDLVAQFASAGLRLDRRVEGTPVELPAAADVVAYRVLQEALTNAHKHGADHSALLHIEYLPAEIALTVTNTVSTTSAVVHGGGSGGHGLVGVRERVASVGGRFEAVSGPGPVFRFTAWLPLGPGADLTAEPDATTESAL